MPFHRDPTSPAPLPTNPTSDSTLPFRHRADMFPCERQQGQEASSLDRHRQSSLMLGAQPGLPARPDLTTLTEITAQDLGPLIVDIGDVLRAEGAHSPSTSIAPSRARRTHARARPGWGGPLRPGRCRLCPGRLCSLLTLFASLNVSQRYPPSRIHDLLASLSIRYLLPGCLHRPQDPHPVPGCPT